MTCSVITMCNWKHTHIFTEEYDIRLDISTTSSLFTDRNLLLGDLLLDLITRIRGSTFDAVLVCEATMRLDDFVSWYSSHSFKRINVLREACVQEALLREEPYERMCQRRSELAWSKLISEDIDYRTIS